MTSAPLRLHRPTVTSLAPRHEIPDASGPGRTQVDPAAIDSARALAVALMEVLYGLRPVTRLRTWVSPELAERLVAHQQLRARLQGSPAGTSSTFRHGTASLTQVGPDAVEAAVVVHTGARTRAVALRLQRRGGRWKVVEFATA